MRAVRRSHLVRLAPLALLVAVASPSRAVQPNLRLYSDEWIAPPLQSVLAGINAEGKALSTLTSPGAANAAALEALSSWNFTPMATLSGTTDSVTLQAPVSSAWTCYLPDSSHCGFDWPGNQILTTRTGKAGGVATRNVGASEYDADRGLLLVRASVSDEGGDNEVRLCLDPNQSRPEIALAAFPHVDGNRRYLTSGDPAWSSPQLNCSPIMVFGGDCGVAGATAYLGSGTGTTGLQTSRIVKAGTITLPSGHVVDGFLLESFVSATAKVATCPLALVTKTIRQWTLTWVVPGLGVVASISSDDDVASLTAFTTAKSTFVAFGLLPPLSMTVGDIGGDRVKLSWTPGSITRFVDSWQINWLPEGSNDPPSTSAPIPVGTTSMLLTGLDPGTTYRIWITARRTYTDPFSHVQATYTSLSLPQATGADANGDGTQETSYPPAATITTDELPASCVTGDIAPDGFGDGVMNLADVVLGIRKAAGAVPVNIRDETCGDVAPGAVSCQPQVGPANWCVEGDGIFDAADVAELRHRIGLLTTFSCATCE